MQKLLQIVRLVALCSIDLKKFEHMKNCVISNLQVQIETTPTELGEFDHYFPTSTTMDALTSYTTAASAWFTLQSLPLLLYPRLIITLLSPTARDPTGASAFHRPTPVLDLRDEVR